MKCLCPSYWDIRLVLKQPDFTGTLVCFCLLSVPHCSSSTCSLMLICSIMCPLCVHCYLLVVEWRGFCEKYMSLIRDNKVSSPCFHIWCTPVQKPDSSVSPCPSLSRSSGNTTLRKARAKFLLRPPQPWHSTSDHQRSTPRHTVPHPQERHKQHGRDSDICRRTETHGPHIHLYSVWPLKQRA